MGEPWMNRCRLRPLRIGSDSFFLTCSVNLAILSVMQPTNHAVQPWPEMAERRLL